MVIVECILLGVYYRQCVVIVEPLVYTIGSEWRLLIILKPILTLE